MQKDRVGLNFSQCCEAGILLSSQSEAEHWIYHYEGACIRGWVKLQEGEVIKFSILDSFSAFLIHWIINCMNCLV